MSDSEPMDLKQVVEGNDGISVIRGSGYDTARRPSEWENIVDCDRNSEG